MWWFFLLFLSSPWNYSIFTTTGEEIFFFISKLLQNCFPSFLFAWNSSKLLLFFNHSTLLYIQNVFSSFRNALNCKKKNSNFPQIKNFAITENLRKKFHNFPLKWKSFFFSLSLFFLRLFFALDIPSRLDDRLKSAIINTQKILRALLRRSMSKKFLFFFSNDFTFVHPAQNQSHKRDEQEMKEEKYLLNFSLNFKYSTRNKLRLFLFLSRQLNSLFTR